MVNEKSHSRTGKTVKIPIDMIHVDPDLVSDPQYSKLFSGHHRGVVDVGLTRMHIDDITPGFYLREAKTVRHILQFDKSIVPSVEERIRKGFRPLLEIYWNPLCPKRSKWVCPDDEASLFAYRALNVEWVPCGIYKPLPAKGPHAVLIMRKDGVLRYKKCIPPLHKEYVPALVREEEHNQLLVLDRLMECCAESRAALRAFHLASQEDLHFHQMLDCFLRRHVTSLTVIRQLLSDGHLEHASVIVRMTYEAFLNLYIDWLSPEFMGPRMQIFSHVQANVRELKSEEGAKRKEKLMRSLGGFQDIFKNTRRKAHLSPLGDIVGGYYLLDTTDHPSNGRQPTGNKEKTVSERGWMPVDRMKVGPKSREEVAQFLAEAGHSSSRVLPLVRKRRQVAMEA